MLRGQPRLHDRVRAPRNAQKRRRAGSERTRGYSTPPICAHGHIPMRRQRARVELQAAETPERPAARRPPRAAAAPAAGCPDPGWGREANQPPARERRALRPRQYVESLDSNADSDLSTRRGRGRNHRGGKIPRQAPLERAYDARHQKVRRSRYSRTAPGRSASPRIPGGRPASGDITPVFMKTTNGRCPGDG